MKSTIYTTKELKPKGWLLRQLEIQANGLSGNLDRIWPDIRDSAWVGGNREGWERVPYWLDGFIPLAYLLENDDMIARARRYIDAILSAQKPDGWICPCEDDKRAEYDTWAVLLVSKVLTVYYQCSGDERIPDALYRVMKNYYTLLSEKKLKLFSWGKYRWFEGFIALNFLYEQYREPWIADLGKILREQGADYASFAPRWKRPLNKWTFETHIVNLGMMLKSEAVSCALLGGEYGDFAEKCHNVLEGYNGTAAGLFTGDECLSGSSPIQGTELCAVVEQMYSYELLYAYTGERKWAERLELLAFNALPATFTDDMWAHQYVQMSNQIACVTFPGRSLFRTNGSEAHIFGLEPNFGCCTANLSQGYPKLALSAFVRRGDVIECALPLPSKLCDGGTEILLDTEYPFKNAMKYTVSTDKSFTFKIRIPSFAKYLKVNGERKPNGDLAFDFAAGEQREINVEFVTEPYFESRPNSLATVKCGSLVFSLPIKYKAVKKEYVKDGVERKFPYCDYELFPESAWNYAFSSDKLKCEYIGVSETPFSSEKPPLVVHAKAKRIDWGFEDGFDSVCAKIPASAEAISGEEEITLYPYGCAKLRMSEIMMNAE